MSVDLPAFGKPTRPTSASSFSSSRRSFLRRARPAAPCAARGWSTWRSARCPCRLARRARPGRGRLRSARSASRRSGCRDRRSSRRPACRSAPAARDLRRLWPVQFEPMPCCAALGVELGMEAVVDQRVGVRAGDDEDRAAVAAVAAARAAARDELLAAERQAAAPAVARRRRGCRLRQRTCESGNRVTASDSHYPITRLALLLERHDADDPAVCAVVFELHAAGDLREDRVVLAAAGVQPGRNRRPRWRTMMVPPLTRLPS